MNALITGCNGFVGKHLADFLRGKGYTVCGIDLQEKPVLPWVQYAKADITVYGELERVLSDWKIGQIYHLAAVASTRIADEYPLQAVQVNVLGGVHLLEYARKSPHIRILFVGSSEQYKSKDTKQGCFTEEEDLEARNIYGATRIAFWTLGKMYQQKYGLTVFFTRSFNHSGPGQAPQYVLSNFAKQIISIKKGEKEPVLHVGNIKVSRDFTDVRDVVKAYVSIMEKGMPGEVYNVCSGKTYSLEYLLDIMLDFASLKKSVNIKVDPVLLRSDDPEVICGDNSKLKQHTGWRPEYAIETTVKDLMKSYAEES